MLCTHVEAGKVGAVRVECLVVEVGELLCDGVDVGHGGGEGKRSDSSEGKRRQWVEKGK